ncbi:azole resistance protein 1 [Scheffersomyces coipomensis]|uniref:azole resistance protein 1 n=1 Tax=Scheffersomyces coipomensis TaxID=1788519 RepID=UPI00315DC4FA
MEKTDENYLTGVPLILCTCSIILAIFVTAIDQSIVITALEGIEETFDSASQIGWASSGYILPMAVLALAWGKCGIVLGRKNSVLISLFLFELGSVISAVSHNMSVFIAGRVITGIGAGGIQTNVFLISSEITPLRQRGLVLGVVTMTLTPAAAIGPLIGGIFTDSKSLTWRWCFWINLPFGGIAALFLFFLYKPKHQLSKSFTRSNLSLEYFVKAFDLIGVTLISISLTLFLVGCSFGGESADGFTKPLPLAFVIIGAVLFVVFIIFELFIFKIDESKEYYPMIPAFLIVKRQVLAPAFTILFGNLVFFGISMYVSIYFQNLLGMSPKSTGIHLLPMIIPTLLSTMTCGIIVSKVGIVKPVLILGAVLSTIATGLMTLFNYNSSSGEKIGFIFLIGFAYGFYNQSGIIAAQLSNKENKAMYNLIITAFMAFSRSLGSALAGVIATAIYTSISTKKIQSFPGYENDGLQTFLTNRANGTLTPDQFNIFKVSVTKGLRWVFFACLIFGGLSLISSLLCFNETVPIEKKPKTEDEEKTIEGAGETTVDDENVPVPEPTTEAELELDHKVEAEADKSQVQI